MRREACDRIRRVVGPGQTLTQIHVGGGDVRVAQPGYETSLGFIPVANSAWAYQDCGLTPGPATVTLYNESGRTAPLSDEVLGDIQADHLVAAAGDGGGEVDTLTNNPLWQWLPAVRNDRVHFVDNRFASDYFSAIELLEERADAIAGSK